MDYLTKLSPPTKSFHKYSGAGNDFILIDHRMDELTVVSPTHIRALCDRYEGVGADGVIFLINSKIADCQMRIFNADGIEASMCGNGLRCLAKFFREVAAFTGSTCWIETPLDPTLKLHECRFLENQIKTQLGPPVNVLFNQQLEVERHSFVYDFMDNGVRHVVLFFDDIDTLNVDTLGEKIMRHPNFAPQMTNVNFVCYRGDNTLVVRTYEKGVNRETLACGTGAMASAHAAKIHYSLEFPIYVFPKSGQRLEIENNWLTGPAKKVFAGEFPSNELQCAKLWKKKNQKSIQKLKTL
ncbi:MAG: diaminopimelate epimerase [Chlamydiia bacterium]|nr:diaminopimelate epimerase [Chlamydiia bacterium]